VIAFVLLAALTAGVFYFSNLLGDRIRLQQNPPDYNLTIDGVQGDSIEYTNNDPEIGWADDGYLAISSTEGGWVQTEGPTSTDPSTRTITEQSSGPDFGTGQQARLDGFYFFDNPKAGMDIDYEDVTFSSPAGKFDAWFVPGDPEQKTWVIFTHGLNSRPQEGLRTLDTTHSLGYPTMLITYRNDPGQPATDGYASFGGDEWEDLEGAVQYALDNGAEEVFLVGYSHGGAVTLSFLLNSSLAEAVPGVFLDAPASNFSQIVNDAAADMGAPGPITGLAKSLSQIRFGINWDATDYTARAADFRTPMTIVQGTADTTVPPEVNKQFMEAVNAETPGLVDLYLFDGAEHTAEWNTDRPRFEEILTGALDKAAAADSQ
jgi:alpha-beta hydrolase superfamily lysophospholipase